MKYRITHLLIPLVIIALAAVPVFAEAGSQDKVLTSLTEQAAEVGELAEQAALAAESGDETDQDTGRGNGALAESAEADRANGDGDDSDADSADSYAADMNEGDVDDAGQNVCADDENTAGEAENNEMDAPETDISEEEGITLIAVGCGSLSFNEEGYVVCEPDEGCEVVSITADKDAEDIRKGRQIPELEITEIEFEEDTTLTAVFQKAPDDSMPTSRPASASAAFGS